MVNFMFKLLENSYLMTLTKKSLIVFFVLLISSLATAQDNTLVGSPLNPKGMAQGGFYDYSDPASINIRVNLWGFVKFPGQYIVPENLTLIEVISLAGGPMESAHLQDIRVYRTDVSGSTSLINIDYDNLMWGDKDYSVKSLDKLLPGDVILIPGEPRWYLRDYFSFGFSVVSTLLSIILLTIQISN